MFMADLLSSFIGQQCFDTLFVQYDVDVTCVKLLTSKLLGLAIISGACIVKMPQILSILHSQSIAGLSFWMFFLELVGYALTGSYAARKGFAFSTYGENLLLFIQSFVIVILFIRFDHLLPLANKAAVVLLVLFVAALATDLVPLPVLETLQYGTTVIFAASRVPQITANYTAKRTGKLSLFMCLLNFFGSAARVFTTMQELKGQFQMLLPFLVGGTLNFIMLLQILIYGSTGRAGTSESATSPLSPSADPLRSSSSQKSNKSDSTKSSSSSVNSSSAKKRNT